MLAMRRKTSTIAQANCRVGITSAEGVQLVQVAAFGFHLFRSGGAQVFLERQVEFAL